MVFKMLVWDVVHVIAGIHFFLSFHFLPSFSFPSLCREVVPQFQLGHRGPGALKVLGRRKSISGVFRAKDQRRLVAANVVLFLLNNM